MEHAEFGAKVAEALLGSGREVINPAGIRWWMKPSPGDAESVSRSLGWPDTWRLADPAPLTEEQAEAAAKAGACFVVLGGSAVRSFRDGVGWCHWRNGSWYGPNAFNAPARGCEYVLAPDPSRAAESMDAIECEEHAGVPAEEYRPDEDEPVTFGLRAAQAAMDADGKAWLLVENSIGMWGGWPVGTRPYGEDRRWMLRSDPPPTAEQVAAVVKAEPDRLCAKSPEWGLRAWLGVRWLREDDETPGHVNPDSSPGLPWSLAIRPDYKPAEGSGHTPGRRQCVAAEDEPEAPIPRDVVQRMLGKAYVNGRVDSASEEPMDAPCVGEYERMVLEDMGVLEEEEPFGEPEPQDTLLACMRWCDDRDVDAVARRHPKYESFVDCRILSGDLHSAGLAARDLEASDWLLSTDEGATWFSPSKGPEVEPRSGAELRRWLHDTGRKALVGEHASKPTWWDRELCDFYTEDGPASVDDDMSGKPLTGTWES